MEYKIRQRDRLRLIAIGTLFFALGAIWIKLSGGVVESGLDTLSMMLNIFFCVYGAVVLAKPFFSQLKADDRGFTVRIGMNPKRRVQYADVAMALFDRLSMRIVIQFEDGYRFSFEYIFDDINGFIKRLSQNGIDVQRIRSNPV